MVTRGRAGQGGTGWVTEGSKNSKLNRRGVPLLPGETLVLHASFCLGLRKCSQTKFKTPYHSRSGAGNRRLTTSGLGEAPSPSSCPSSLTPGRELSPQRLALYSAGPLACLGSAHHLYADQQVSALFLALVLATVMLIRASWEAAVRGAGSRALYWVGSHI